MRLFFRNSVNLDLSGLAHLLATVNGTDKLPALPVLPNQKASHTNGSRLFEILLPSLPTNFNERTGTEFNFLEMPTDVVFQVVLFRLLFKLSLRDLVQMFLIRGYELSHETVRDWEARFAPL